MKAETVKYIAYGVAIVTAGAVIYQIVKKGQSVGQAVKSTLSGALEAINPTSPENIVYRGVSNVASFIGGDGTSGQSTVPLGTRMWEWLNPAAVAAEKKALSNGQPDKSGRFMIGGDSDEFGNLIDRTSPVPSGPPLGEWGPSIMSEMTAP